MPADATYQRLLHDLEALGAYGHHQALTGSRYIRFANARLGSLRIADHEGRRRHHHQWNVWVNRTGYWTTARNGREARHYGLDALDRLVADVHRQHHLRRTLARYPHAHRRET